MTARRIPRDVLQIIFTFVDDSVTWSRLSQVSRAARQFGKQLLIVLTRKRKENMICRGGRGFAYTFVGTEQYQTLPCGLAHGRGILTNESHISITMYLNGSSISKQIWYSRHNNVFQYSALQLRVQAGQVQRWLWEMTGATNNTMTLESYVNTSHGKIRGFSTKFKLHEPDKYELVPEKAIVVVYTPNKVSSS